MGATTFFTRAMGKSALQAFDSAVTEARYQWGNGGYTGTIAEKQRYVVISLPAGTDPYEFANKLIDEGDPRVDDKWGPAGCVKIDADTWLFFGWASE